MIKSIIVLSIFMVITRGIFCQDKDFIPVNTNKRVIDQLNDKANRITSVQSDFTQTKFLSYLSATVESKGKFLFKKENKVRWEYTEPYKYTLILNNGKLSILNTGQNELKYKENKFFNALNGVIQSSFQGKIGTDDNFETQLFENNSYYLIKLIPKNKDIKVTIYEVCLYFEITSLDISHIKILEASGDYTLIKFTNRICNETISDSFFIASVQNN